MIGGWGAIPEKTIALAFPIDPFRKQETSDKIHEIYKTMVSTRPRLL